MPPGSDAGPAPAEGTVMCVGACVMTLPRRWCLLEKLGCADTGVPAEGVFSLAACVAACLLLEKEGCELTGVPGWEAGDCAGGGGADGFCAAASCAVSESMNACPAR